MHWTAFAIPALQCFKTVADEITSSHSVQISQIGPSSRLLFLHSQDLPPIQPRLTFMFVNMWDLVTSAGNLFKFCRRASSEYRVAVSTSTRTS